MDAAFQLVRRHYATFVMLVALIDVPWLFISMIVMRAEGVDLMRPNLEQIHASYWLITAIASLLLYSLIEAVLTAAASDSYLEDSVSVGSAFRPALRRVGAVAGTVVARAAVLVVGFLPTGILLGIVAGIGMLTPGNAGVGVRVASGVMVLGASLAFLALPLYLLSRYFASGTIAVLERLSPLASLRRSATLTREHRRRVMIALLLLWGAYFGLAMTTGLLGGYLALRGMTTVAQIIGTLVAILILPVVLVAQTLLYYDLRIRKEGYDIELMAQGLGVPVEQAAH